MGERDILEEVGDYRLGAKGPWIAGDAGTGKVLTHFLDNVGRIVSLERIAGISGWKNPRKQFRRSVQNPVNAWSKYQIEKVGRNGYRMAEKR